MSYDIYIGNAELESEWPGEDGPRAEWIVNGMELPEAPNKPDLTGRGNGCHPGYGQWHAFARDSGLEATFFDKETGLITGAGHPGIAVLTHAHLESFEGAERAYRAMHPNGYPGSCAHCNVFTAERDKIPHDENADFNFYRLEWLVWWTRWALQNCERPAMMNR